MITLRFGAHALPLNPIVWRKADRVYRCRNTFPPSAINRYFMRGLVRDTDILVVAPPRYRKTFSLLTFTWIVFSLCFFLLFNKRILFLILLIQTRQFRVLFYCEELYLSKILYLRGKAGQLTVLTFYNSPITRLAALECGSARELVISVTLNSVRQTTTNACALR